MSYNQHPFWNRFFNSRIVLIGLVFLVIFIGYSIFKERKGQVIINEDIKSLEREIGEFGAKNLELAEMIKYFQSDEFVEREAREKLNMAGQGEKVVIVPENGELLAEVAGDLDVRGKNNWELWAEYFFGEI